MEAGLLELDTTTGPTEAKKPQPVELRTARDYSLATQALTSRVDDLKDLAKKNEKEQYHREAKNILADAAAIEHFILPQFRTQQELPLKTPEQVRTAIAEALRPIIRPKLVVRTGEKDAPVSIARREEELAGQIATRVMAFAQDLFEEAYNAGHAARENTFEVFALRSMNGLYGPDAG